MRVSADRSTPESSRYLCGAVHPVHKRRHLQWQSGDGIEQIAASEGVTYNAVKHSLLWCEARLSHAEVLAAHQTRLRLQAFGRLSRRYWMNLKV